MPRSRDPRPFIAGPGGLIALHPAIWWFRQQEIGT